MTLPKPVETQGLGDQLFFVRGASCPETIFRLPHGQGVHGHHRPPKGGFIQGIYMVVLCVFYLSTLGFFPLNL